MINYKTNIFLMSVMLLLAACSSEGKDSRFTENPVSHVTAPEVGEGKADTLEFRYHERLGGCQSR